MLLINIIILIATLFLIFYANFNIWIGIVLFMISAGYLLLFTTRSIYSQIQINRLKERAKLKWIDVFNLVEGFDLVPNQTIYLGLTRKDALVFFTEQKQIMIELKDVEGILLTRGSVIQTLSDASLKRLLNRNSKTNVFLNVRSLIQENMFLKNKMFILISLTNQYNASQDIHWTRDFIVLKASNNYKHLNNFIKRPEIRSKAKIYQSKTELKSVQNKIEKRTTV